MEILKEQKMKKQLSGLALNTLKLMVLISFISSCTKTRKAELPEDQQQNIFALAEIPETSSASSFSAKVENSNSKTSAETSSLKAFDANSTQTISSENVEVPERFKFMFDNLEISNQNQSNLKITFSVNKDFLTVYKIVQQGKDLNTFEKSIAQTENEIKIANKTVKTAEVKSVNQAKMQAATERDSIVTGKKNGSLLVPLFKYKVENYGILQRTKNDLKESTSVLAIKPTDWANATHIQLSAKADSRLVVGNVYEQRKAMSQIYNESKIDHLLTTAKNLKDQFNVGLNFIDDSTNVFTRLDEKVLHIYEVTKVSSLTEIQKVLLKNNSANQSILSCQDPIVVSYIQTADTDCALILRADLPISYKAVELSKSTIDSGESSDITLKAVPREQSKGLVEILENTLAKQIMIGNSYEHRKSMNQLYNESKVDHQLTTVKKLKEQFNVGLSFIDDSTNIFTRLDDKLLHIYEVTKISSLNENQKRLLKNNAANQSILSCQDPIVANYINSDDKNCVIVLRADIPITYKTVKLSQENIYTGETSDLIFNQVPRSQSKGLVEILENAAAKQVTLDGILDPNSSIRLSDLNGEFFYRRTFEAASNMFLGRTGTSGDMTIVKFELEDGRIVVRNQQSLIQYTGQGPKDREELMSFPVKYIRMNKTDANGSTLTIPVAEETTKEKAEYAIIDWTKNTIPDSNSPLAFYSGGNCLMATSSLQVTDTDMRLAQDGVLNYSLSGSYTVKPEAGCYAVKDVNSAYWGGSLQWNFNVTERISFLKHKNPDSDKQFSQNISSMAQSAFNFGVFTLADKVTGNGKLDNRDGSEKYMPIIHDFRNGRKLKYYIGGLNNKEVTTEERRQVIIEASRQVIDEWNKTLRYAFRGTSLERDGDYVEIVIDEGDNTGHLGDLDRNYIWYQELDAENGLLGVAQPAANPRAGTIESANVIIYSGNTYNQTERLLQMTEQARQYEKLLEAKKQEALAEAQQTQQMVNQVAQAQEKQAQATNEATQGAVDTEAIQQIKYYTENAQNNLVKSINYLQLNKPQVKNLLNKLSRKFSTLTNARGKTLPEARQLFKQGNKGQRLNYSINEDTFIQKLTQLAVDKKLSSDAHQMELAVNSAFLQYESNLLDTDRALIQKRSELLAAAIKFDQNTKNRAGCYMYSRAEINDEALSLDSDPHKNLMMNFKKNIMSTLSHELGHAFGLLHNFKASTDKANYEFPEDKDKPTGRNYSSIMDYIADIDMKYAGPGPYDAQALRAAYTGKVEVNPDIAKKLYPELSAKIQQNKSNLVDIQDIMAARKETSLVHYTKDTLNKIGLLKYYEQCDDGGLTSSSMCAQFDVGGSATEIVQNAISDYQRGYYTRNFVYDKILFGFPQKIQIIQRNISTFQKIRSFLDEAVMTAFVGSGRTQAEAQNIIFDQANAAKMGYMFFHELLRTPDASGMSVINENRYFAVPYTYNITKKDDKGQAIVENGKALTEEIKDIRILEAKANNDVRLDGARDKMNTFGISYDKSFALSFLLQSSAAQTTDDTQSRISQISYIDFEQWFLGATDPSQSLTLNTLLDMLSNRLTVSFFTPPADFKDVQVFDTFEPLEVNSSLAKRASLAAIVGLAEAKWQNTDAFADSFKMKSSTIKMAPKDRLNVVRAGENRKVSDTRVSYADQQSVASSTLIQRAAQNEFLLDNKKEIFSYFQKMYDADKALQQPILALKLKACEVDEKGQIKDTTACDTAKQKTTEDFIKENPQLSSLKKQADNVALMFANYLRKMNLQNKEVLLAKDLDTADSNFRFENQVNIIRSQLMTNISLIERIVTILKATPAAKIPATIQAAVQLLLKQKNTNASLEVLPVFLICETFITEMADNLKVQLQDGSELTGSKIAAVMLNGTKVQDDYSYMIEAIDSLSQYTGMLYPEAIGQ